MNFAKITLTDMDDLNFTARLKLFVLINVPLTLNTSQQWLLYSIKIPSNTVSKFEYVLITDNIELFNKTLDLTNDHTVLDKAPDGLPDMELTYGFQQGISIGRYNC